MPYTAKDRVRINLRARRKLGQMNKQDAEDHYLFMQQCVADMIDNGEADDELEAQNICELLWEEGGDLPLD